MNGFAEPRASGSPEGDGLSENLMTWEAAHAMLPLVSRVSADVLTCQARLDRLATEKESLDATRLKLAWPRRERRYEVDREIATRLAELDGLRNELQGLGVTLLDAGSGLIGFPTIVNDRRAFFSWKPGEVGLAWWNYLGEKERFAVPSSWTKDHPAPRSARTRTRSR